MWDFEWNDLLHSTPTFAPDSILLINVLHTSFKSAQALFPWQTLQIFIHNLLQSLLILLRLSSWCFYQRAKRQPSHLCTKFHPIYYLWNFTYAIILSLYMYVCVCVCVCVYTAKSRQSCQTLCDSIDSSPTGSSVPGIPQHWSGLPFHSPMHEKWKVKVNSLSHVQLLATPWTVAYQAPPSMGFSRQEYWSGLSLSTYFFFLFLT